MTEFVGQLATVSGIKGLRGSQLEPFSVLRVCCTRWPALLSLSDSPVQEVLEQTCLAGHLQNIVCLPQQVTSSSNCPL